MDYLRRAENDSGTWDSVLSALEGERIVIENLDEYTAEGIVDDYQYDDQKIYSGEYKYTQTSHPFDSTIERIVQGEFYFRTETNLFILRTDVDNPSPSEIIEEFNVEFPQGARIHPGIQLSNTGLWNFIKAANERLAVNVLAKEHKTERENPDLNINSENLEDYLVRRAELVFLYDSNQVDVIYNQDSISINSTTDSGYEYVIQVLESEVFGE